MIDYADARTRVLAAAKALPAETVLLLQALERILARDIRARENIPPFTKATMDGYAVRAADTRPPGPEAGRSVVLTVLEDLPAGRLFRKAVGPGQAVRIMTGAPLPDGADAVVMVEDTESAGPTVRLRRAVKTGDNIGLAGEDLKKGEIALVRGTLIGPAETGMLAAAHYALAQQVANVTACIDGQDNRITHLSSTLTSSQPTAPPLRRRPGTT